MTPAAAEPRYLEPTPAAGRAFAARPARGVVMLNLLRFRPMADYADFPLLAPDAPITGAQAYERYIAHTLPYLHASGGEVLFRGAGDTFLIGPDTERWDEALLVRQASSEAFLAFAQDAAYLAGLGHRRAALEDSRLLPLLEQPISPVRAAQGG